MEEEEIIVRIRRLVASSFRASFPHLRSSGPRCTIVALGARAESDETLTHGKMGHLLRLQYATSATILGRQNNLLAAFFLPLFLIIESVAKQRILDT